MSLDYVQRALTLAVKNVLGDTPTGYENEAITPPSDAKWAEVHFLPNTPEVLTLGEFGEDLVDGIIQIDLNYPIGTGGGESRTDYERIRLAFPAGSRSAYNGQDSIIRSCGRTPGRPADGWFKVSVTIYWYALIPR